MCDVYRLDVSAGKIASAFGADNFADSKIANVVERGLPGFVIAGGRLRHMHWGLPNIVNRPGKPRFDPNAMNTATGPDKDSWIGRDSFVHRRCIVPMSALAERQEQGRSLDWFGIPGRDLFVCAGVWRDTLQTGPAFTLIFRQRDSRGRRQPFVLTPSQISTWLFGQTAEAEQMISSGPLVTLDALQASKLHKTPAGA